ncbi:MAG: hypothetical protein HYR62_08420 [Actinobacteria bacterium]|nr:hypothetical protein [Actinomycetota bacterium]MBI3686229.1 hypothetical protein [Actinomycetota bacterium]
MDLESQLRLNRDATQVADFLAGAGGRLVLRDSDPDGLYWVMIAGPDGHASFVARIAWNLYPDLPPSVLFAVEAGGATTDTSAWPSAPGYRAPTDVCKPFTAEGQGLHPEWRSGPHVWRTTGNPFLFVVENLHADIHRAGGRRAA